MTSVKPRPSDPLPAVGPSEFEVLKRNHRFLREDESSKEGHDSWGETLALKFYSNLWKEYAICDLKHYKSGNFALRWRTEDEVVSGAGETSCGNSRCKHHEPVDDDPSAFTHSGRERSSSERRSKKLLALQTLELPFGYVEHGEARSALVKVVLCERCVRKIMWKREMIKKAANDERAGSSHVQGDPGASPVHKSDDKEGSQNWDATPSGNAVHSSSEQERRRRRRSRSRSPNRRSKRDGPRR